MLWLECLPDHWWQRYSIISHCSQSIEELNIELLFIVRTLLLETRIYARTCKRTRLFSNDFQVALDCRNIRLTRRITGDECRLENDVISISSIIEQTQSMSNRIDGIRLTMHWLAIDGEQPIIAENPIPVFEKKSTVESISPSTNQSIELSTILRDQSPNIQKLFEMSLSVKEKSIELAQNVHPLTMNNLPIKPIYPRQVPLRRSQANDHRSSTPSLGHELSLEQQLYFQMLTESCFNGSEQQRTNAFRSLSSDAALQPLLPRLLLFISQGIQTNIHQRDLRFVIRFLSMLKMLTINSYVSFEKFLHLIISTLLTCLLCIFDSPKTISHTGNTEKIQIQGYLTVWIVREQASDLLIYFTNRYSTIRSLTKRIISILKSTLDTNRSSNTYSIVYGSIRTLLAISAPIDVDVIQEFQLKKTFESDLDLDPNEQQTVFGEKLRELTEKYSSITTK